MRGIKIGTQYRQSVGRDGIQRQTRAPRSVVRIPRMKAIRTPRKILTRFKIYKQRPLGPI